MSEGGRAKEAFPESAELGCPFTEPGSKGFLLASAKPGGLRDTWLIKSVPQPGLGSHTGLALPEQVPEDSERAASAEFRADLEAEQSCCLAKHPEPQRLLHHSLLHSTFTPVGKQAQTRAGRMLNSSPRYW